MNDPRSDRPSPETLFGLYHLGLDDAGRYAFRNARDICRELRVDIQTLMGWLKDAGIDGDTVKHVDFKLSPLHVDCQLAASPEDALAIRARAWAGYLEALKKSDGVTVHLDVDYDALEQG
jgi:hypothetical protein